MVSIKNANNTRRHGAHYHRRATNVHADNKKTATRQGESVNLHKGEIILRKLPILLYIIHNRKYTNLEQND